MGGQIKRVGGMKRGVRWLRPLPPLPRPLTSGSAPSAALSPPPKGRSPARSPTQARRRSGGSQQLKAYWRREAKGGGGGAGLRKGRSFMQRGVAP